MEAADRPAEQPPRSIRQPIGPDQFPERLSGRWLLSLCVSQDHAHAWIRFENVETGELRSISRYHMLVGGWFDRRQMRWIYPPTVRPGLSMDRDQRYEEDVLQGGTLLAFRYVDDPPIFIGGGPYGHGVIRNNCVTYARDAWYFYTGEFYELPMLHTPSDLLEAVAGRHPEMGAAAPPR
jgi:hypothetical protein